MVSCCFACLRNEPGKQSRERVERTERRAERQRLLPELLFAARRVAVQARLQNLRILPELLRFLLRHSLAVMLLAPSCLAPPPNRPVLPKLGLAERGTCRPSL